MIELIKKYKEQINNDGREYYFKTKETKEINVMSNGKIKTINSEEEVYTNFFKLLVNQKLNYLLAKEPSFKMTEKTKYTSMLEDMILNASLDGIAWLHVYYDKNGINFITFPSSEVIPFYDRYNNLIKVVHFYNLKKDELTIDIWTKEGKQTLVTKDDKVIYNENSYHTETALCYGDKIVETSGKNFNEIPFIPLLNNKCKLNDLVDIKELIDYYNSISHGFIDNVYKFQEAIVKLTGFSGDECSLKETMENLRRYKVVGVPTDGNIEYLAIEIPVEARKVLLDILKQNIFSVGRGLDIDKVGDGNITNVVIMARYAALDMKSNEVANQAKIFWSKLMKLLGQSDETIVFNKTMLINEVESIQNCVQSIPLLSIETILANHPWVVDVDKEIELLLNSNNKIVDKTTVTNDNSVDKTTATNEKEE